MTRIERVSALDNASVRRFVVETAMDHLGSAQLEFQESLFALHQEIDHYKFENPNRVTSIQGSCPLLATESPKPVLSIDLTVDQEKSQ